MKSWRIAVVAALACVLWVPAGLAQAEKVVTVYAHRGGSASAPENTLGAFRHAQHEWGSQGVWLEMDTQLSADGVPVIIHDDTLDRTTDCAGTVGSHTAAALALCDAGAIFPGWGFEPVPTFEQVFTEGRDNGWRVMVEIKDIPLESNFDALGTKVADALLAVVNRTHFPADRLIVESFWPLAIDNIELKAPFIRTALLTASTLPGAPAGVGVPATANALYSAIRSYEISSPDIATLDANATVFQLAQALGRQVVVWTPDTDAQIAKAVADGVDGIISNRPDRVFALR